MADQTGQFVEQLCPFCEKLVTRQDAIFPGIIYLDFRRPAHKACREARYAEPTLSSQRPSQEEREEREEQASMAWEAIA